MYMGVIPSAAFGHQMAGCAPHVYGGDPTGDVFGPSKMVCSPCIWG